MQLILKPNYDSEIAELNGVVSKTNPVMAILINTDTNSVEDVFCGTSQEVYEHYKNSDVQSVENKV